MNDSRGAKIYTVSELNRLVRDEIEKSYSGIRLRGEISNLQKAQSGHRYFKLKDRDAEIDCALFSRTASRLSQLPEEGMEVILTGQLTIYIQRGRYQFIVSNVELKDKKGELYETFLERKEKLQKKGYFEDSRKKDLPALALRVGIVTSSTGAAVQDVIRTFKRRNPLISLMVYPTSVQGDTAAKQIAKAIESANRRSEEQILIVARGGGDIEDLWAFNEEIVADAIFNSEIPIITGIGHETDFTIADFVADQRAATPTAAAELASTPSRAELLEYLDSRQNRLCDRADRLLNDLAQEVDRLHKNLFHPAQRIETQQGKFQLLQNRLEYLTDKLISSHSALAAAERQRLLTHSPKIRIDTYRDRVSATRTLLDVHVGELQSRFSNRVENLLARLDSANPSSALKRGFSIIRRADDDTVVSQATNLSAGDKVKAQLMDGTLNCDVKSIET